MLYSDKLHALEISLTVGCKLDCKYCPQSLLLEKYFETDKRRNAKLRLEDFKTVLEKVREGGTISFCGMSEPFHNEACADMIVYAHEKGYKISLLTTLVGMTLEDFEKIKNIPFDSFVLHIPDKEHNSKFVITEEYLELLKKVNEKIKIDYYSCHGTPHDDVVPLLDQSKYAGITLGNRAGNLFVKGLKVPAAKKGSIVCYHGSEKQIGGWAPVMLPDGTLVLCCMDYGMKHQLGNLISETWENIQKGEEFQRFQRGLQEPNSDILCRRCGDSRAVETLPSMQIGQLAIEMRSGNQAIDTYAKDSIIARLSSAETVCVFGLGKLFKDHFFQEYWNVGLEVKLFSDNNKDLQEKAIEGIPCVAPERLGEYKEILVVIFVKDAEKIKAQLKHLGIENCVTIDEIMEEYCKVVDESAKKLSV